ncbi:MAG: superoxide dismutase [Nanoarchaeota archaeon]
MHNLPKLEYAYNALEPYIDEQTMKIHHTKHHQTYVDKLNVAIKGNSYLEKKSAEALIRDLNEIPDSIKNAVRNHGGGHLNHSFFWQLLKTNIPVSVELSKVIKENFGTFETFKEEFTKAALGLFGSGWCWLVINENKLEIMTTQNQDNPLSQGKVPILGLDLWEHGYYLKYQNKRNEYIEAFFNVINWDKVEENYNFVNTEF